MSNFYSVKKGDKLKFKGCTCGYGLYLGDVVECIGVALDKFYWVNPYTGDKRITKMGSSCFEPIKEITIEEVVEVIKEEVIEEVVEEVEASEQVVNTEEVVEEAPKKSRKKKSE